MTRAEFEALNTIWEIDTQFQSSNTIIMGHKAVALLQAAGEEIVPWLIEKVWKEGCWVGWLTLLEMVVEEEEPFEWDEANNGRLDLLRVAWLNWWEEKNNIVLRNVQKITTPDLRQDYMESGDRAETGALEINGDWTGMFIRGDEALPLALHVNTILNTIQENVPVSDRSFGLNQAIRDLEHFRNTILEDVIDRKPGGMKAL